jgi:hypothetical protein
MAFHWSDAEFTLWSFISHLMLAIVVVSGINLVFTLAAKTARSHDRSGAPESVCRCSPRSGLRCPAFSKTP